MLAVGKLIQNQSLLPTVSDRRRWMSSTRPVLEYFRALDRGLMEDALLKAGLGGVMMSDMGMVSQSEISGVHALFLGKS